MPNKWDKTELENYRERTPVLSRDITGQLIQGRQMKKLMKQGGISSFGFRINLLQQMTLWSRQKISFRLAIILR